MAIGDLAGSKGLATYTDALLVADVDTGLNQRGDDIAATMTRLDKVEPYAIGVPKFSVQRGTNGQLVGSNVWSVIGTDAFATPVLNTEFTSWTQGALTVKKTGVYQVSAHVQFFAEPYSTVAVQLVKNGGTVDSQNTLAKDEWSGPGTGSANPSATAYNLVRLVAGDVVRLWVLQRGSRQAVNAGISTPDLTMSLLWVDA